MSIEPTPWLDNVYLLRIHAQWFPVGARFLVRCGRGREQGRDVPMLGVTGWLQMPDTLWEMPTLERLKYGLPVEVVRKLLADHFTPVGAIVMERALHEIMLEPRLIEGGERDEYLPHDPRIGYFGPIEYDPSDGSTKGARG